jgi:hypothetical protein
MYALASRTPATAEAQESHAGARGRPVATPVPPVTAVSTPTIQRHCACGGGCPRCEKEKEIQTKLAVGPAGDIYEQEADELAARVLGMPEPRVQAPGQPEAPSAGTSASTSRGAGGEPLTDEVRRFMEPRFGADFGDVRVHAGAAAAGFNRQLHSRAFTHGRDIWLAAGENASDRRLLAHELTHVLQQTSTPTRGPRPPPGPRLHTTGLRVQRDGAPVHASSPSSRATAVSSEKWRADVESSYRRAGFTEAANAVQGCREFGDCSHLLTESEAWEAYRSGRVAAKLGEPTVEDKTEKGGTARRDVGTPVAMAGLAAPALAGGGAATAETAVAKTALERAALRWGTAAVLEGGAATTAPAAAAAPAAGVATVAVPIAVGVVLVLATVDLFRWGAFQSKLRALGYVILPNPLGVCIGLCHQPAAPRFEPVTPLLPTRPLGPGRISDEDMRRISEWLKPTSPSPKPDAPPYAPPLPVPDEDEETRRRGCTVTQIEPKFGRYPCHSDFAKTFSGTRREFRVTNRQGIFVDYDAKRGRVLYEVKTGYEWVLNPHLGPDMRKRRAEVIDRFQEQAGLQLFIATQCGFVLDWYFNKEKVAEYFQSLVEPKAKWKPYDCDKDSDHTW